MDIAKVHAAKVVSIVMPDLRLKRTPQPPYSPNICLSDFFVFGWVKEKLPQQQSTDTDQPFAASMKVSPHFRLRLLGCISKLDSMTGTSYGII
jgi:hypothetical protein